MAGAIAAWCYGSWLILPVVRGSVSAEDMLKYVLALIVGHVDGFRSVMDILHLSPRACLGEPRSSHYGRLFAAGCTHYALDGHAVIGCLGGNLLPSV
jgi:hypothetical protein